MQKTQEQKLHYSILCKCEDETANLNFTEIVLQEGYKYHWAALHMGKYNGKHELIYELTTLVFKY